MPRGASCARRHGACHQRLLACGNNGSEYLGKWQSVKYANRSAVIERNGDAFIVKITEPMLGTIHTDNVPAVLKDGMLQLQVGFGTPGIAYVKANDTILMPIVAGTTEYKRVK